jgi:hypothetical protein
MLLILIPTQREMKVPVPYNLDIVRQEKLKYLLVLAFFALAPSVR